MKAEELAALQRIGQLQLGQPVVLFTDAAPVGGEVLHFVYGDDSAPVGIVLASAPDTAHPEDIHHIFIARSSLHAVEWAALPTKQDDDDDDE